jgi:hypothetical protein
MELMTRESFDLFEELGHPDSERIAACLQPALERTGHEADRWTKTAEFVLAARMADAVLDDASRGLAPGERPSLAVAYIARLALSAPSRIAAADLPDSVLDLYPKCFDRLARHLRELDGGPYDHRDEAFCKDLRFVLALTVPIGALSVDLESYIPWTSVVLSVLRSGDARSLARWLRAKGPGVWLRIHADSRYLDDFDEAGWEECYLRIADLLARRPAIRGLAGTSWFYDPRVAVISPRLAYLRRHPIDRGATFMKHGTGPEHVERATATSGTRRRLHREGRYTPTCYSLMWPRTELLAWAETVNRSERTATTGASHAEQGLGQGR